MQCIVYGVSRMKYISGENGMAVLELSRRNLTVLLAKLDDPLSACALVAPDGQFMVRVVEEEESAAVRLARLGEGVVQLTRGEIRCLLMTLDRGCRTRIGNIGNVSIRAVEDHEHYHDRRPGLMWMPSLGEML